MHFNLGSLFQVAPLHYFKKNTILGLDLGFKEIRLLQLEKKSGHFHIEKMLSYPYSNEKLNDQKKTTWAQAQEQLSVLVRQAELAGCSVILALPGSAIIKKQIEIPLHFHEDELAQELQQRLGHYFPGLSEKEIHFDFVLKSKTEEKYQILVVATRKELLQTEVAVVSRAGLRVRLVDVDLYALARAGALFFYHDRLNKTKAAALLDLRWPVFTFIAFNDEDLIFHYQGWVERELVESPPEQDASLVQQLRQVWQLCRATHPKLKIEFFGLAGEAEDLAELAVQLEELISLPVKIINPFQAMTFAPQLKIETVNKLAPRFLLCCGLAMRGPVL